MTKYFELNCKKASIHFRMLAAPIDLPSLSIGLNRPSTPHCLPQPSPSPSPSAAHWMERQQMPMQFVGKYINAASVILVSSRFVGLLICFACLLLAVCVSVWTRWLRNVFLRLLHTFRRGACILYRRERGAAVFNICVCVCVNYIYLSFKIHIYSFALLLLLVTPLRSSSVP